MTKIMISARVDVELNEKLETLAEASQRSKAFLITEAVASLIAREEWLEERIAQAVKAADATDERISHEAMVTWMESWGTANPLPPPKPDIQLPRKQPKS